MMELTKDELFFPQKGDYILKCVQLDFCLLHGFNCVDCPHIPENKRIYDPYSGEKLK